MAEFVLVACKSFRTPDLRLCEGPDCVHSATRISRDVPLALFLFFQLPPEPIDQGVGAEGA